MANARRVTEAEALGEVDQTPDLRAKYAQPSYFDIRIPEDQFERIRLEAREATYRNSAEEEAVVAAVDRAIFERVQAAEVQTIEIASRMLDEEATPKNIGPRKRPNALQRAEDHLAELAAIKSELRAGKTPTADLAERYEKVRRAIQTSDGNALIVLANKASNLREKVSDPMGTAQRTLGRMPLSTWRPLGIRSW